MDQENSNLRTSAPHPAAQAGLEEWHRIVTERDWDQLPALLVDDVTYHNPAQFEPYRGLDALVGILRLVFSIFADFDYHRTFGREDALEFSARVGEDQLFGVDLVRFNEAGKKTDLVVMLRPASVVTKLGEEAARRMAAAKSQTWTKPGDEHVAKLAIVATIKTVAGKRAEYLKHLNAHAQRCRATESGTLVFEILLPQAEADTVMLYEVYASSEAFDAHLNGASIQQMRRDSAGLQVSLNGVRCDLTD